jgi:hypothetical protein
MDHQNNETAPAGDLDSISNLNSNKKLKFNDKISYNSHMESVSGNFEVSSKKGMFS